MGVAEDDVVDAWDVVFRRKPSSLRKQGTMDDD
jgi:hypothetical protein